MPAVEVSEFKGLYDKPDGIVDEPTATASLCHNVIIHEGDICNLPFVKDKILIPESERFQFRLEFHYYRNNVFLVEVRDRDTSMFVFRRRDSKFGFIGAKVIKNIVTSLPRSIGNWGTSENRIGKMTQVGQWLIMTGKWGGYFAFTALQGRVPIIPYMFRIRHDYKSSTPDLNEVKFLPLGLQTPFSVWDKTVSNGSINERVAFAVTFITTNDRDEDTSDQVLPGDDIESNALILNKPTTYVNKAVTFDIVLPSGYKDFLGIKLGFGIYARLESEGTFSLYKYIKSDGQITVFSGRYTVKVLIDGPITRDTTQPAPIYGTETAQTAPRPSYHSDFFKGRMYYATIPLDPVGRESADLEIKNRLEISREATEIDPNLDRSVSYIWDFKLIGRDSERITGVIVFGTQLIIFKETEIWVLTDDFPTGGKLIVLFTNRGCVSTSRNRAYIVVDRKLFFGDQDGIYVWIGRDEPIRISDPVRNILESIKRNRYKNMHFSVDPRYNLLFVNFPKEFNSGEELGSLIYNYKENTWTNTNPTESSVDHVIEKPILSSEVANPSMVIVKVSQVNGTGFLGTLEDRGTKDVSWVWKTNKLTLGKQGRRKHWKYLRIETESQGLLLDHQYTLPNRPKIVDQPGVGVENHVGLHSNSLQIQFGQKNNSKPFRINGYELEAHIEGRR